MSNIIYGNSQVNFGDSVYISIVSMLTVFFVLIIISSVLSLLKHIPSGKKDDEKKENKKLESYSAATQNIHNSNPENTKKLSAGDIRDEKMMAAISVALIEAAEDNQESYIRIRSIRELN